MRSKDDYDLFADLVDNPDFSWEKIVPVYEQVRPPDPPPVRPR